MMWQHDFQILLVRNRSINVLGLVVCESTDDLKLRLKLESLQAETRDEIMP